MTIDTDEIKVIVYAVGLAKLSCCALADMQPDEIEAEVNRQEPTGISSRWTWAHQSFATGQTNPCKCDKYPSTREHWLLEC